MVIYRNNLKPTVGKRIVKFKISNFDFVINLKDFGLLFIVGL